MRWLAAIALAMLYVGCTTTEGAQIVRTGKTVESARTEISVLLDTMHNGIEQKKIYQVLGGISGYYQDVEGRTQADLRDALKNAFAKHRKIRITRTNPRLEVNGATAIALESIGVIAESGNVEDTDVNWFGELKIWLEISDAGRWQIVRIERNG